MAASHQIELATPSDARLIDSLSRELVGPELASTWNQKVTRAITDPSTNVAVVRDDGDLVAFGILQFTDNEADLVLLAVTPRRQRQGIGRALLGWLEATAFVAGVRCISVEITREDSASTHFYRGAGYRKEYIDRSIYWKSLDEIRMKDWLSRRPQRR